MQDPREAGRTELLRRLRAAGRIREAGADAAPDALRQLMARAQMEPAAFADLVAETAGLKRAGLGDLLAGEPLVAPFSQIFLSEAAIFPYRRADGALVLALADPFDTDGLEAVALTLGQPALHEVASYEDIDIAMRRALGEGAGEQEGAAPADAMADGDDVDQLRDLASGAPVIQALDELFERAASLRATDIHVEPTRSGFQLRLRIDGVLRAMAAPPGISLRALTSRIKIMSGLNIAERRVPQDGRAQVKLRGGRELDVRVATMPTTQGEAAILRLLERGGKFTEFSDLGFSPRDEGVMRRQLAAPYGLIVVTGPTGSGKTTTLASALSVLNDSSRKILTIEDPVEYEIAGISQSQVRPAVGLTFASALRAFLRQDPDVIMVGEMRDQETARICIQASLTGHLVLSTLHTNSAASAITRLSDMGIEPYLVATSLGAIVAQRLVRVLCPDCRRPRLLTAEAIEKDQRLAAVGLAPGMQLYEPAGCERCGGIGYRGRQAIFEVIEVGETLRRMIIKGQSDSELEAEARRAGMDTMMADGIAKALGGMTSVDEVFRVATLR
ncbi:general secretion pathway protein GspE [Xaviernesmea oryzae]|uniref:General secretion pathway protein GspE n=1 Tax=Xaviernesmea oryzae TaxID=464029 RepID=A0A1Q9AQR8_9HYPH|nr:GspE/PulE family protein [Xaviernesmea oryzae]OLP57748.1 general secretion pathway protein GspE [Xaviernesmea oryzae]SEM06491.1 general secretion pathway protein E [Xaviernesmea oryzae]